jgi:hypothetical protein
VAGAEVFAKLHRWLHALPGMPAHVDHRVVPRVAHHAAHVRHALRVHPPHAVRPPRVLRAWQAWIGALFGVHLP